MLDEPKRTRATFAVKWTDAQHARLVDLNAKGLSYDQIARQMGITKNMVAGRAFRTGLSGTSDRAGWASNFHKPEGERLPEKARRERADRIRFHAEAGLSGSQTARLMGISENVVRAVARHIGVLFHAMAGPRSIAVERPSLAVLESYRPAVIGPARSCQYVQGKEGRQTLFCGTPSVNGYSYCADHCRVCYVGFPHREKQNDAQTHY